MDLHLDGRTALVTGASRGIGRMIAVRLSQEGVQVAIAARRTALLEGLADEVARAQSRVPIVLAYDLYADGAPQRLAHQAVERLGRIDILINAAGGSRPLAFDAPDDAWQEGMALNFGRQRELTHALASGMRENGFGRIINLTGTSEPPGLNAASAAKAAVHAWSKGFSREFARYGVTINCLQPGRIESEQMDRNYPDQEERKVFCDAAIPTGRFGHPEELADLATFLCSPRAGYITGTVIPVDGGMSRFAF